MNQFKPGNTYGVLHLNDHRESVTIASRDAGSVTLTDGRKISIAAGAAPGGGTEEVLRLGDEPVCGVVRVCHLEAA